MCFILFYDMIHKEKNGVFTDSFLAALYILPRGQMTMRKKQSFPRFLAFLLFVIAAISLSASPAAAAQAPEQKVVRVGWYDSSFCYRDEFGRRCGIDVEYQEKISAYTGWTFEYREDSWSNLFQMLKDGEIDLLSDVSYKPERTEFMSFPDLPMGSEAYYIYIDADNREITANNPASFTGKRIGVNSGSIQEGFLTDWAERNGIDIEIVPLDLGEADSLDMPKPFFIVLSRRRELTVKVSGMPSGEFSASISKGYFTSRVSVLLPALAKFSAIYPAVFLLTAIKQPSSFTIISPITSLLIPRPVTAPK